jgi:hypothetical protein
MSSLPLGVAPALIGPPPAVLGCHSGTAAGRRDDKNFKTKRNPAC